jgi:hypothetical protein
MEDFLLPEEVAPNHDGDVEEWVSVYEELLGGNRRLLREVRSHGGDEMEAEAEPIERNIQRLEARLAFWAERPQ